MLKRTMMTMAAFVVLAGAALADNNKAASDQHSLIGVQKNKGKNMAIYTDPVRKWYPEDGLGLFIHWGLSSVDGHHDLSWGMMSNTGWGGPKALTPAAYWKLVDQFNPQDFHPEKWLKAAKDAGFGFAVLTTRHHEGYALWPSEYGDFNTKNNLNGRDLVREYVEACHKVGIKVGFYYSPPDWHYNRNYMSFGYASKGTPDKPHLGLNHEPITLAKKPAGFDDKYSEYVNGQVRELMTRYGKIDLLWFDGSSPKIISQDEIRKLQPDIVINDRGHGHGDYGTGYECKMPATRPVGCWEHCCGLTSCWGYQVGNENSDPQRLAAIMLSELVKCRAWGGNMLPNCGPRPTGEMPKSYYGCMDVLKNWMASHRESVVGVEAGCYPERANVPVTVRGKTWYLHLVPVKFSQKNDPAVLQGEGPIVLKGVERPKSVVLLGSGEKLESKFDAGALSIAVPQKLRTNLVDVVKVEW
jgi:alpha-L-fucosidase